MVLLNASNRRISKRPICFNLAPPQSRRTRDPDMLSAVGLSDIDCPCGQDKKSRRFYSDHQSTLVAIGIGRHVRVGSKGDLIALKFDFRSTTRCGLQSDVAACPKGANRRLMHRNKNYCHSITSSARPRSVIGNERPSFFAVLGLITNSTFVVCSTGMSAGLAPLRILPM